MLRSTKEGKGKRYTILRLRIPGFRARPLAKLGSVSGSQAACCGQDESKPDLKEKKCVFFFPREQIYGTIRKNEKNPKKLASPGQWLACLTTVDDRRSDGEPE
jgi:hypothetical protein